jgi:hypothetical protein
MKVQEVTKEAAIAKVGVSVEFSNSEIASIQRLTWTLDDAIEKGKNTAKSIAKAANKPYDEKEPIPVSVDLRTLLRVSWLLGAFSNGFESDIFNQADGRYACEMKEINENAKKDEVHADQC